MSGNDLPQPPQQPEPAPAPQVPAAPGATPPPPPPGGAGFAPPSPQDSPQAAPQPGYPQGAYPQPGYPQQGYPQQGYPQPGYPQPGYPAQLATPPAKPGNGLAVAGFVVGLLGFLGSFGPVINVVGMVLGVVGAILAGVGLAKSRTSGVGKGLAIAGLALGVLAVVIGIVVNVVFAGAVKDAVDEAVDTTVTLPSEDPSESESATDSDSEQPAEESSAPAEVGASRDNPAPLGSTIAGADWTVTVNSVTTATTDSMGQGPQAGSVLLVVNVSATYTGTDDQGSTTWASIDFVTADGTTISPFDGSTYFIPENQFDTLTTVYSGGTVTGDQIIEVPADTWQTGVLAVSPDLFSDATFVAVQ